MDVIRYVGPDAVTRVGLRAAGLIRRLPVPNVAHLLAGDLADLADVLERAGDVEPGPIRLLAPVDGATEVWAAGVTYRRSREARAEESREADVYQRVYEADRPELFFKSVAWRVSGPGEPVAIRTDSTLDVAEPELALALTASGEVAGYAVCNDMSSRSIEGENPLYLPQAKIYAGGCALGPAIRLANAVPDPDDLTVALEIRRRSAVAFQGTTNTGALHRTPSDLARWLYAGQHFPSGAILSTGTGIVPDLGFTLEPGDEVTIRIDGIGTLVNPVVRGKQAMAWLLDRAPTG